MQTCVRCGEEFAPARFITDLKKTLYEVGENYSLQGGSAAAVASPVAESAEVRDEAISGVWWQDLCPECKRVLRAQANLAALGRDGNQFL
jgi:hypothetical protein